MVRRIMMLRYTSFIEFVRIWINSEFDEITVCRCNFDRSYYALKFQQNYSLTVILLIHQIHR
jgi:hypothetical protein